MTQELPAINNIRKTILDLFPEKKPQEQEELLKLVLQFIDENHKIPNLANDMEALKPHIKAISLFEDEFNKTIKQYTNLNEAEKNDLKKEIKKDMDELAKKGLDLKKNPKAFEVMMKLLVLKHCLYPSPELLSKHKMGLKHKLKVDPTIEMQNNLSKLKVEFMKLLKEIEKTDPKLVLELKKVMKDVFLDMDKKIESQKEPKEELAKLFRALIVLKAPEFKDLPPEDKVTIITQGSKAGQYAMIPKNDVDMPNDIMVFPNTPAANEIKDPEAKSRFDLRKTPTLNPYDKE